MFVALLKSKLASDTNLFVCVTKDLALTVVYSIYLNNHLFS